jgi:hypothetical protein
LKTYRLKRWVFFLCKESKQDMDGTSATGMDSISKSTLLFEYKWYNYSVSVYDERPDMPFP